MKHLAVLFLGSLFLAGAAQATSLKPTSFASLSRSDISPGHPALMNASEANILIHHFNNTVRLSVVVQPECPQDHACIAVLPQPVVIELPIVNRFADSCGSYFYEAEQANPPVGGEMKRLTVIDNTGNHCATTIALPATEVEFETSAARPGYQGPYVSKFYGERLH